MELDFGIFIAYFIPGYLIVAGPGRLVSRWRQLLNRVERAESFEIGALVPLAGLVLSMGLAISIVRYGVLDALCNQIDLSWMLEPAHWHAMDIADVDYGKLAVDNKLEVYQELVLDEKRPYQFYGNLLLSLALFMSVWAGSTKRFDYPAFLASRPRRIAAGVAVMLLAICVFYSAYRHSFSEFQSGLQDLGVVKP